MLAGVSFKNVRGIRNNGYHLIDDDIQKVEKVLENDMKIAEISYQEDGRLQLEIIMNKKQSKIVHDVSTVIIQPLSKNGVLFKVSTIYGLIQEISKKHNDRFFSVIIDE